MKQNNSDFPWPPYSSTFNLTFQSVGISEVLVVGPSDNNDNIAISRCERNKSILQHFSHIT